MASNINIKVTENVKRELDEMKLESESYNVLLQRLMRENKELRQDKDTLMKIAMKTPDSIAFPQIAHYVMFSLMQVLKDDSYNDEEKLNCLRVYLRPQIEQDPDEVISCINEFKEDFKVKPDVLNALVSWIEQEYKAN